MATTIGELNVKLNLEMSRLEAQITQANSKINRMSRSMQSDIAKAAKAMNAALSTIGGGIALGSFVSLGKSILDLGGKITDLSNQAGISTDAFQTLAYVAAES